MRGIRYRSSNNNYSSECQVALLRSLASSRKATNNRRLMAAKANPVIVRLRRQENGARTQIHVDSLTALFLTATEYTYSLV